MGSVRNRSAPCNNSTVVAQRPLKPSPHTGSCLLSCEPSPQHSNVGSGGWRDAGGYKAALCFQRRDRQEPTNASWWALSWNLQARMCKNDKYSGRSTPNGGSCRCLTNLAGVSCWVPSTSTQRQQGRENPIAQLHLDFQLTINAGSCILKTTRDATLWWNHSSLVLSCILHWG